MSRAKSFDLKAGSPLLLRTLADGTLTACPFCGGAMVLNHAIEIILHEHPQCTAFSDASARVSSFAEACALLEQQTVYA